MNSYINPMGAYPMQPNYFNANYQPQQMQNYGAQTRQSNVEWVYVNGLQGAREQIVQPGCTAWMMDNNDPVIYVKSVDQMGSASLRGFRLEEISARAGAPETTQYSNELSAMNERISRLESAYNGLVNDLGGGARHEPVGSDSGQAGGK